MPILQQDSGFTLIEVILSIMLIGILAAVGSTMISDSYTTARVVNASNTSEGEARYVMERLAREIREVKLITTSGVDSYCITTMTSTQMVFNQRTDPSSLDRTSCTTASAVVTIGYSAPNLNLTVAPAASAVLSSRASSFSLSYLESDGATATTSNVDVRFVVIQLTVTDATGATGIAQRVRVALRNS